MLLLGACATSGGTGPSATPTYDSAAVSDTDTVALDSRIGRMAAMIDEGDRAVVAVLGQEPEIGFFIDVSREASDPADARYLSLVDVVSNTLNLRLRACRLVEIDAPDVCDSGPFIPDWATSFKSIKSPSARLVETWAEETEAAVTPLWGALCERATAKTGDETFCAIE